jgi:hypothetical protein
MPGSLFRELRELLAPANIGARMAPGVGYSLFPRTWLVYHLLPCVKGPVWNKS